MEKREKTKKKNVSGGNIQYYSAICTKSVKTLVTLNLDTKKVA